MPSVQPAATVTVTNKFYQHRTPQQSHYHPPPSSLTRLFDISTLPCFAVSRGGGGLAAANDSNNISKNNINNFNMDSHQPQHQRDDDEGEAQVDASVRNTIELISLIHNNSISSISSNKNLISNISNNSSNNNNNNNNNSNNENKLEDYPSADEEQLFDPSTWEEIQRNMGENNSDHQSLQLEVPMDPLDYALDEQQQQQQQQPVPPSGEGHLKRKALDNNNDAPLFPHEIVDLGSSLVRSSPTATLSIHHDDIKREDPKSQLNNKSSSSSHKHRPKKPKPQSGPSKPLSAYNLFFRQYRLQLLKSSDSVPFSEMGKQVGRQWKLLSKKERLIWEDKAEQDSQRYRTESLAYKQRKKRQRQEQHKSYYNNASSTSNNNNNNSEQVSNPPPASTSVDPSGPLDVTEPRPFPPPAMPTSSPSSWQYPSTTTYPPVWNRGGNFTFRTQSFPVFYTGQPMVPPVLPGATELPQLPPGFQVPSHLPPSGSTVAWPDASTGQLNAHTVQWKVYSVPASQAPRFLQESVPPPTQAPQGPPVPQQPLPRPQQQLPPQQLPPQQLPPQQLPPQQPQQFLPQQSFMDPNWTNSPPKSFPPLQQASSWTASSVHNFLTSPLRSTEQLLEPTASSEASPSQNNRNNNHNRGNPQNHNNHNDHRMGNNHEPNPNHNNHNNYNNGSSRQQPTFPFWSF